MILIIVVGFVCLTTGRITSMNSIAVWIGANDRGSEGGWKWANRAPFAFLNWGAGSIKITVKMECLPHSNLK